MGNQAYGPGTYSFTAPATSVRVQLVAGGGSGGAGDPNDTGEPGTGGYAGQYIDQVVSGLTIGQQITVSVGSGGAAVQQWYSSKPPGNPGGNSSFGVYVSCTGGSGGQALGSWGAGRTPHGQASGYPGSYGGTYTGASPSQSGYRGGGGAGGNPFGGGWSGAGGDGYCQLTWTDPPPTKIFSMTES